jgi:hypothetical protein
VVALLAYQHHQNTIQAELLAAAYEQLQTANNTAAEQEGRREELERQAAAIVETRSPEQALAQLRARRAAGAKGNQAASSPARTPVTLLSATLADPAAKESLREQLVSNARNRWEPVIKELKLSPEQAEKLYQIAGDSGMKNVQAVVAFCGQSTTDFHRGYTPGGNLTAYRIRTFQPAPGSQ